MNRAKERSHRGIPQVSGLILASALGVALAGCDSLFGVDEQEYVSRGVSYYQDGRYNESMIELRNALQQNSENEQARFYLGVVQLTLGDYSAARRDLERARELGYDGAELALPLAQARLASSAYTEVLDVEPGDDLSQADRAELHAVRGRAYLMMEDAEGARKEFRQALSADPGAASARFGQVLMARIDNDPERMRRWVERTLSADEHHVDAWRTRALLDITEGRDGDADYALDRAVESASPPVPQDLYRRAMMRLQRGDLDAAAKDARQLVELAPDLADGRYMVGLVELRKGNTSSAQTEMEAALSRNSRLAPARLMLGVIHGDAGRYDQARYQLERYQVLMPDARIGSVALAALEGRKGNTDAARQTLNGHLQRYPDDANAQALRTLLSAEGDTNPSMVAMVFSAMGAADDIAGSTDDVVNGEGLVAGLDEAGSNGPSEEDVRAIRDLLSRGDYEQARDQAETLIESYPDVAQLYNLKAGAYLAMGELQSGVDALAQALEVEPGNYSAVSNLGQLLLRADRRDDALRLYRQAHEANPDHLEMHLTLARLEHEAGNTERSNELVADAVERHPDAVEPRMIHARRLVADGDARAALEAIEPLLEEHGDDEQILLVQADAHEALGEHEAAIEAWSRLVERHPDNAELRTGLARSQARMGDTDAAIDSLHAAIEGAPDKAEPRVLLIHVLLNADDAAAAEAAYQDLISTVGESSERLQHGATVAFADDRPDDALQRLQRAQETNPSEQGALTLAQGYQQAGRQDDAHEVLEDWYREVDGGMSMTGRHLLAALRLEVDDTPGAIELYEDMLAEDPDDPVMLNNLAWALRESDPKRAVTLAERAAGIAPGMADIDHTLAVALHQAGDHRRALELMEEVVGRDDRPTYRLELAEFYLQAGDDAKAEPLLRGLADADFDGVDRANTLLESLAQ
ncbi:tetratricopeptide repeat protein [Aquisalimonas sp. APHAB1-3]|uniref:tetratricopeptide repeat protein n=1 Tax=Aquisalimonas sp. APHAB1-3 TaxID=3402080 RepID=UPI003AAEE8EF